MRRPTREPEIDAVTDGRGIPENNGVGEDLTCRDRRGPVSIRAKAAAGRVGESNMSLRFEPSDSQLRPRERRRCPASEIAGARLPIARDRNRTRSTRYERASWSGLEQLAGNYIWSVPLVARGNEVHSDTPSPLFPARLPATTFGDLNFLAVSRDGSRFYIPQALEQPDSDVIHVRVGWAK